MGTHKAYKYDAKIAKEIRDGILEGYSLTKIHDNLRHRQNCPASWSTINKIYQKDIAQARMEKDGRILSAYWKAVEDGNPKLIELGMRSQVGWEPTSKVTEVDGTDPDEAADAVDILLEKLGHKQKDTDSDADG